jgi:regulator of ribonuclease activity A
MLGDQLAGLAHENGWAGVLLYGCVRDTEEIREIEVGVKALAAHPRKSIKRDEGQRDLTVCFADVAFVPGHHLYADPDGIIVSEKALL